MVVVVGEKEWRSHVVGVVQHVMLRCMGWGRGGSEICRVGEDG